MAFTPQSGSLAETCQTKQEEKTCQKLNIHKEVKK